MRCRAVVMATLAVVVNPPHSFREVLSSAGNTAGP